MTTELDKAREALAQQGHKSSCGKPVRPGWACGQVVGHDGPCGVYVYGVRCAEWKDHLRAALTEIDRLTAALAEAEATLANERGEGEPPEPGWAFCDPWPEAAWVADFGAEFRLWCNGDLVVKRTDRRSPSWRTFRRPQEGWGAVAFGPSYPTARAAMRAATTQETP